MLPSLLAREIQNGLKHFLTTGFEPSDPLFAGVMQRFTEDEARWMKGPYIQMGLPFRTGTEGRTFFGDFETAFPGHVHQDAAWQRLTSNRAAASTLVATGTGSGKTECFLYPLLDHCARANRQGDEADTSGVKALVIYPMNALAADQARRFAQVIAETTAFKGLRVGLFVGGRSGKDGRGLMAMTASSVITDRETLRKEPPDILLTNYKMLDYLLIRPKDRLLWTKNTAETLRYVVVDELHTFDGAQGTDLALLLRRLRARLQTPDGHLICAGTSATLGGNADTAPLREYARQIFGVGFPPESVVTENRLDEIEFLGDGVIEHVLHPRPDFDVLLDADRYPSPAAAVEAWFRLFFPGVAPPGDVNDRDWRSALGEMLKKHLLFINLLKLIRGRIVSLVELQEQMQGPLPEVARPHIGKVLDALLVLVAWARDANGQPLVTLRVQLWMRELRRMVTQLRSDPEGIELRAESDVKREPGKLYLPLLQCADCHTTGWLSRLPSGQSRLSTDLDEIYNTWFSGQPEALRLYSPAGLSRPLCDGIAQRVCTQCGHLQSGPGECAACGHGDLVAVFRVTASRTTTTKAGITHPWHDPTCPACGSKFRQLLLGARNATLGAVTIEQTWASPFNDDKKLIAFSDSVQDAAHRAGFFTARTYLNTVRTGLAQVIDQVATPQCSWNSFLEKAASLWQEEDSPLAMPVERFVAEFIGPNMMWQRDWAVSMQTHDSLPQASHLPERVRKRLRWQAFAEFTYLSRRGRNLDAIGKATLAPRLADIERAADALLPVLQESFGIRHAVRRTVVHWLWGFVCHLRQRGAVAMSELMAYARDGNIFAFTRTQGRGEWLPGMGERTPHPVFLSLGRERGFDHLVNPQAATFFQTWLLATLGAQGLLPAKAEEAIYTRAIEALVQEGVLLRIDAQAFAVVALNPAALLIETRLERLVSAQGKRALTVPADSAEALLGMPCLDASQETYAERVDAGGWLARRFSRGDLRRVFSAEHTGLLQRDQREALELRFKARDPQPWYENLLSATPTLEMGVDIGDLSSVLLCAVPPNQASYLQRIGRAGRRDGNAFTATLADGASPHDLYFFEDTDEMLQGEVVPPGIFLKAAEVLRRQMFAFCLDDWVGSGIPDTALPDKTQDALNARDSLDQTRFPYTFLEYILVHEERLLGGFMALLGEDLDDRVAARLRGFMQGNEEDDALRLRLSKLLEELARERKTHRDRGVSIRKQIKGLKTRPQDEATRDEIDHLERERQKALELVKEINQRDLLNTLTDAGMIPNYAFPEAGVELKSLLWRKKGSDDPENSTTYISLPAERYERPAQSALSEFAPENVFYANQRRVEIDQINVSLSSLERWRMCPTCQHMENLEIHADSHASCPRCGDPMWANVSQQQQLLRFKQAIANSNDTDVRIDDSAEDREPKFYVRQMLADFEIRDIREAYRLAAPDMPFGFEFIERVVFRDVNFGEPTKPGESYAVAGQQKPRPGFKLCKHCGQIQRAPRNARERELVQFHAFDCEKRGSADPENIIDCLYLYREFSSEALRILVPYTRSGVDEASVQSFMAALRIGLKKRFGGKVDHLRMVTQEEKGQDGAANRQYVMLYDSVPGGTGYLHELLANEAQTLLKLFCLALTQLGACSCNADPEKDGCYRCVYQYRLGRAMALVSRDRARAILEQLVDRLGQLERVASVADIYINPNFDSELEARFIESLRRLSGVGGLPFVKLVQDIVQGKSGYLLEVGEQRYWVEPQVDLGPSDGIKVACRPDFVLWPTQSKSPRRPIAIFCDGWAHHQNSTREDAHKRSALVASGKFWVWSLTWEDVQAAMDGTLDSNLADCLESMCFNEKLKLPAPLRSMLDDELWMRHAVAVLLQWLGKPPGGGGVAGGDQQAGKVARNAGATAFRMLPHPQNAPLEEARNQLLSFWEVLDNAHCEHPAQSVPCGNVNEASLKLRYWWPRELANLSVAIPVSPGFVIFNDAHLHDEPERHMVWRRWLWLFNIFQTLPGVLLATQDGLEAGDHAVFAFAKGASPASSAQGAAHAAAWAAVMEQAMGSLAEGLRVLMDAGLPLPDEVGYELEQAGDVVAEAELAWVARKLVLLMPAQADGATVWQGNGWKTLVADGQWAQELADALGNHGTQETTQQEVQV
ncbi:DEAD/DEAH box helicase [Candidatus Accumulibacter phosphatis]|uniref:DEAD/DEAH box helicase n=1 Tax=Candidatus Accumulibacter phosphatis TaxID=327160 RepID=A0ABX1TQ13_9PROT|nr:DEAD/DEAH box helicase [Candidatus Accumulibacter phosphatis]NMQ26322.1 DEAD/DEAH box helicase [Candidatus Accumulibacter phosphatis]